MSELIEALTDLIVTATIWMKHDMVKQGVLSGHDGSVTQTEKPLSEDVPAKPKRSTKKVEAPAANPNDDILAEASGKGTIADRPTPQAREREITQEESVKAVTDTAKLLVSKYSKPVAPDNKPEGFHIAKVLLLEDFKVGRLSDLSHEQRVGFVSIVKDILHDDKKAVEVLKRRLEPAA